MCWSRTTANILKTLTEWVKYHFNPWSITGSVYTFSWRPLLEKSPEQWKTIGKANNLHKTFEILSSFSTPHVGQNSKDPNRKRKLKIYLYLNISFWYNSSSVTSIKFRKWRIKALWSSEWHNFVTNRPPLKSSFTKKSCPSLKLLIPNMIKCHWFSAEQENFNQKGIFTRTMTWISLFCHTKNIV